MEEEFLNKENRSNIIYDFIKYFMSNENRMEFKHAKEMNASCREIIERRINHDPTLEKVKNLLSKYNDDPWVKEVFISYLLLKMYLQSNSLFRIPRDSNRHKKYKP